MFIRSLARSLPSSSSASSSLSISRQITTGSRSRFRPTSIIACYAVLATTTTNTTTSYAFSTSTTTTTLSNNNKIMPGSPYQYGRGSNSDGSAKASSASAVLDLSEFGKTIMETATKRNDAFDKSRKIQMALLQVRNDIEESSSTSTLSEDNTNSITESLLKIQDSIVEAMGRNVDDDNTHRVSRDANLNQRVEELCRLMAYHHFLQTGAFILPPSECNNAAKGMIVTDEEYLGGACMGLCQDLSRYAMGRACARDINSVQQARDLVNQILDYLLQFDFRNGNLRRKYDGTKYALKVRKGKYMSKYRYI
jgi:predicted translin family RNA/ssDNA-binding protein